MKKLKGSLTIEAVISFTIFLSFMFMLLTIVKFSLVRITLNTAASETAKQIATSAYPMSYLIEYENSVNEGADQYEEKMSLTESISNDDLSSSVSELFGIDSEEVSNAVSTMTKVKDLFFGENVAEAGASLARDIFVDLESKACMAVAGNIINAYIDNSVIPFNKDDISLSIVKFPQSEFAYKKTGHGQGYTDMGLDPDSYSAEDVVIGIEYKYIFAMPFLPSFEIKMRELAVEHAWLYGSGGTITNREDKLDFENFKSAVFGSDTVYLGSMLSGKKYHKQGCRTLNHGAIVTSRDVAVADGYTACKVCGG